MRFKVIVNTHGRPWQAMAVIEGLRALSSGNHEVRYVLAFDEDDRVSVVTFTGCMRAGWPMGHMHMDIQPRPDAIANVWNRNLTDPSEADFFLPMPDDGFCACANWDEVIVQASQAFPDPRLFATGWNDMANPNQLTVPIVSAGWLELTGSDLLDPRFPFWFSDTAIAELWAFVTGQYLPIVGNLVLAGKPFQPSPIMRDTDFWWTFFAATRRERWARARKIRETLGMEPLGEWAVSDIFQVFEARDAGGRIAAQEIVDLLIAEGKQRPASDHYRAAKAAAEAYMRDEAA